MNTPTPPRYATAPTPHAMSLDDRVVTGRPPYRNKGLHPRGHATTATVLGDKVKETPVVKTSTDICRSAVTFTRSEDTQVRISMRLLTTLADILG
jgi:hypothetical protein